MKTPYDKFKKRIIWKDVENLIDELKKNQDLEITTVPDYVTGYIVRGLSDKFKFSKKKI